METLPKELKKILQLTSDSLKSFEYIIMVMDDRIKVEEHYLNGLNKIQGQFNYIKENDPLAFECSALKVDISQRANHNQYLIEQMKSEQDEMKQLLKKSQEKNKEVDANFRESEKVFKQKAFELEKQKEKLTYLSKELEDMTLFYQLIETDVQKSNPKWQQIILNLAATIINFNLEYIHKQLFPIKITYSIETTQRVSSRSKKVYQIILENLPLMACKSIINYFQIHNFTNRKDKKTAVLTKFKTTMKAKEELEISYRNEVKSMEEYVEEYNKQLVSQYDELVISSNELRNSIHDLARKQLVFEVNQIRNVQYDLDNVIKQVDSRPNFAYQAETVTVKLNPHKALCFQTFYTPFSIDVLKTAQEQSIDLEQSICLTTNNSQLPDMNSNFDCISKEERSSIQAYFQKGLIDNLNQISLVKNKKLKDSCHYLMNSVIQSKGDSTDVDVINSDISIILSEIQTRTSKNRQIHQESLNKIQEEQEGKQNEADIQAKEDDSKIIQIESSILKEDQTTIETKENLTSETQKLEENTNNNTIEEEGKKQDSDKQIVFEEKSEGFSQKELKEIEEEKPVAIQDETLEKNENQDQINESEVKQEEGKAQQEEKEEIHLKVEENSEKPVELEISLDKEETQKEKEEVEQEKPISEEKEQKEENEKPVSNTSDEKEKEVQKQEKPVEQQVSLKEEQEVVTDIPPVFFDYSDEQNQAIFLIFLECFRQSGKSQITPQQNNQLVIECFRYLDDLFQKKDILQLIKFMPLTFAIYRLTAAEKVFLQDKVKHHFIWTHNDVWEALIYRSVKDELGKLDPSIADDETVYRNTVYSNLATIGLNMLKFRSTKQNTKNLLAKLAMYYGIPDQQASELVNFIENEGQNEKSLSFVKTSGFSAKPNMTKGRIITFGQPQQQQPAPTPIANNTSTGLQETKINPLLQKPATTSTTTHTVQQQNNAVPNTQQRPFQSAFTPSTQAQKPATVIGGQPNPLLAQQLPLKHNSEYKPSNLLGQEMNNTQINKPNQEGNANKPVQPLNQPVPQFANQQVPIQAQNQSKQVNMPANKVQSKLFGSGQNFALNNKNL